MTTPHPGSRTQASLVAEHAAQPDMAHVEAHQAELAAQVPAMGPVPVMEARPDGVVFSCRSLAAASQALILPQDAKRRRATIIAVDEPIVLCQTLELAQNGANSGTTVPFPVGFYLPIGLPIVLHTQARVYAVNTNTTTATRISLAVEVDESPDPLGVG